MNIVGFGRHVANLGCHFGPSWARKGTQNHVFGYHIGKIMKKEMSRNEALQNIKIVIEIDPKMRAFGK